MERIDFINKFKKFLTEGNKEETYTFKKIEDSFDEEDNGLLSVDYEFSTPTNQYQVTFYSGEYKAEDKTFDLSFGIKPEYGHKKDTFQMTGEGSVRNILKTISNIIIKFMSEYGDDVKLIIIDGTSEKRSRVYKLLFPKYIPSNLLSKIKIV